APPGTAHPPRVRGTPRPGGRGARPAGLRLLAAVPACSGGGGPPRGSAPFVAVDAGSASPTDRAIATAQARLATAPRDSQGLLDLARAFLQKVRETGDPTLYTKAGGILHDLARRTPDDLGVLVTQGTLDLALHRFGEARRVG